MKRARFSTEQIIAILQEHRAGASAEHLGRRHGFSPGSLYVWKQRYGQMVVSDAKRLAALEQENARLKRIVADQALNLQVLNDVLVRLAEPAAYTFVPSDPKRCEENGAEKDCPATPVTTGLA